MFSELLHPIRALGNQLGQLIALIVKNHGDLLAEVRDIRSRVMQLQFQVTKSDAVNAKLLGDLELSIGSDIASARAAISDALNQQSAELAPVLIALDAKLSQILAAVTLPPATNFLICAQVGGQTFEGENRISMRLSFTQQLTASITPVDAKGRPAKLDGVPVWASTTPGAVTLTPAADGLSCLIQGVQPSDPNAVSGATSVTVTADADLGAGVSSIVGTITVELFDETNVATNLEVVTTDPVEQTPAAPPADGATN